MNKTLREYTTQRFSFWQVAANGVWEEALRIAPQEDSTEFFDWLARAPDDVAVEAFFTDKTQPDLSFFFFGMRIAALTQAQKMSFFEMIFERARPEMSLGEIQNLLSAASGKNIDPERRPDFLEIGAEGEWKSYGPLKVWDADAEQAPLSIAQIQSAAPHLLAPYKRVMMLELAWQTPYPMWLGLPLSGRKDGAFQVSARRYETMLQIIS